MLSFAIFHETLTISGTSSGNSLPDSHKMLFQIPLLPWTPKFIGFLSPKCLNCAYYKGDGGRSAGETFQQLLWSQKPAGAATLVSSEERQLDHDTEIDHQKVQCCSLSFSVLTLTVSLCSYQPLKYTFFTDLLLFVACSKPWTTT